MATLQKIRNRGTLLLLVIGLALFLFIIGAILENDRYAPQTTNVADINGTPISYDEFRKQVSVNLQEAEAQGGGLTSQQRDNVELQTWNQMVEQIVLGKQLEELGVSVTKEELSHIFLAQTDPAVKNAFGNASEAQVAALIAQVENSGDATQVAQLNRFKEYILKNRANEKYFAMVTQGLKADSSLMAEATNNVTTNFKYIVRSYLTVPDSSVVVTDDELQKYYNENKELFKQTPFRELSYVEVDVEPSQEDIDLANEAIESLKDKFAATEESLRFAEVNSEIKNSARFMTKEEIKDADLAAFAFSGDQSVYGPYGPKNVLMLAKVVERKKMPDSVRVSHILIAPGADTEKQVDSLMKLLIKGTDFASLAKKHSIDKNSAINGGDLGWFGKGVMVPGFETAAFGAAKGKIEKVQTQFGTHIIKVTGRGALKDNVQLATITKEINPSNKTYQLALTEARHLAESAGNLDELKAAVKAENLLMKDATVVTASLGLPNVNNSKEIVRAAYKADNPNDLLFNANKSSVFEMDESYIIAGLKAIHEGDYASLTDEKVKKFVTDKVRKEKKAEILKKELNATMASAATLNALAEKEGVQVQEANNVSFNSAFISGLGQEPEVVATAILENIPTGKMSPIVEGNQGVYVLSDIEKTEGEAKSMSTAVLMYNRLLQQRASQAYQALYDKADITDERYKF